MHATNKEVHLLNKSAFSNSKLAKKISKDQKQTDEKKNNNKHLTSRYMYSHDKSKSRYTQNENTLKKIVLHQLKIPQKHENTVQANLPITRIKTVHVKQCPKN